MVKYEKKVKMPTILKSFSASTLVGTEILPNFYALHSIMVCMFYSVLDPMSVQKLNLVVYHGG